jgi:hypothetical protein
MLRKMFNNPESLLWIYFLESQMKVSSISMKEIQSDFISGSEVAVELDILSNKLGRRRDENFCTALLYHYYETLKMFTVMNNSLK